MRRTTKELTDLARETITGKYLIPDLSNNAWQISLMLILSGLPDHEKARIGLILVPMGPHHHMHWINNTAPGCTVSVTLVHVNDMARFVPIYDGMVTALHPEQPDTDERTPR